MTPALIVIGVGLLLAAVVLVVIVHFAATLDDERPSE